MAYNKHNSPGKDAEHAFVKLLQQQATRQALLEKKRLLPKQLDWLTSLIGNYPWQVLLVSSGITAALVEIFGRGGG